jgi:DNA-binding HxlR family transcriptional regulator/putative sterol carrier protein
MNLVSVDGFLILTEVKRYAQYCAVARALDLVGERWTLLVVRALLMGPQRYTDLRDALPGIATDLLTARLRTLEEAGYVRRGQLPRPAAVAIYELTQAGWQLGPVVLALARLGVQQLGAPAADEDVNADALVLLLRASFRGEYSSDDPGASYQLELDDEPYAVVVHAGWVETRRGPATEPACTLRTSPRTLAQILSGALAAETAIADGRLTATGAPSEFDGFLANFSFAAAAAQ